MTVIGLDHIQIAMPRGREDDARAFYSAILGFSEIKKPDALFDRGGCWFVAGDVKLHLGVEESFKPALKAHPAFLVESAAMMETRLTASGYLISRDAPLQGYQRFFVSDPFGNRIEIMQRTKD
ncbi:VOC family protein [Rhizobium sp. FKL33]|uniref:VOC family protein n=1 Tax=Rhizobium sp. FKL33 TaxID=2562307 RepID=UPI0010BF843F|nr:VOC family protein [Rhizobium sp. FKL33]